MAVVEPQSQQDAISYREPKPGTVYKTRMSYAVPSLDPDTNTLPRNFLRRVRELGDQTAMRKKRYGIWQEYSWNDLYDHVCNFFHGLISLGLQPGETLCIIGENNPEMYWAQIAAHSAGAMSNCVFSDALPDPDLLYAVTTTGATFIIAHDQEQVDKALAIKDKVPQVRRVIYWEDRGMWSYDDPWLAPFEEIEALGREHRQQHPNLFEERVMATQPEDTIILSMTSGTTSLPKFAQITNHQLVYGSAMNFDYVTVTHQDNWLSFSPMAWMTEQAFGFAPFLLHGMQINFPEGPETVATDMREIAPVGLLFPSRVWENLASTVRFRINDSTWVNRKLYDTFMPVAYQIIDLEDAGQPVPGHLRALRQLGEVAFFGPLRDKIGLTRARELMLTGRRFKGAEAQAYGLVHQVCEPDDLDSCVAQTLAYINKGAPGAIAATKQLIFTVQDQSLDNTVDYRADLLNNLRRSAEGQEGMLAFVEKRPANWTRIQQVAQQTTNGTVSHDT